MYFYSAIDLLFNHIYIIVKYTYLFFLQGHHDYPFWAIHLIWGSVRGSEGHVLHGQRPALHHEVDRWGRYDSLTLHPSLFLSTCTAGGGMRGQPEMLVFLQDSPYRRNMHSKQKSSCGLHTEWSSRLNDIEATCWNCQNLSVPCVKMNTCSHKHTLPHMTVRLSLLLSVKKVYNPPPNSLLSAS